MQPRKSGRPHKGWKAAARKRRSGMSDMERVGEALRKECLEIFGTTWNYDNTWRLARAAIAAMIQGDAEPIGHRAPLPRIDLQPIWPVGVVEDSMRDEMWRFQRQTEADRIWRLVEQACEGDG